jgi:hypothetical protein
VVTDVDRHLGSGIQEDRDGKFLPFKVKVITEVEEMSV